MGRWDNGTVGRNGTVGENGIVGPWDEHGSQWDSGTVGRIEQRDK